MTIAKESELGPSCRLAMPRLRLPAVGATYVPNAAADAERAPDAAGAAGGAAAAAGGVRSPALT